MKMRVMGMKHSYGDFTPEGQSAPIHYNKYLLWCIDLRESKSVDQVGYQTKMIEFKNGQAFMDMINNYPMADIVNHIWDFEYDDRGNVVSISLVK